MENNIYAIAYSEVLDILNFISKEDYEKIPLEIIEALEDNCDEEYQEKYNPKIPLDEQDISKEAKTLIAILFRDYWATEKQREKILSKEKYDNDLIEIEKQKNFNEDIFKKNDFSNMTVDTNTNKEVLNEINKKTSNEIVIVEKRNWFKELFNKIKSFIWNRNK